MNTLPASIRDMAQVLGWPATIAFVRAFGGKRVYIPKRLTSAGVAIFEETLGVDGAAKLVQYLGDTALNVPACRSALNHARNVEIVRAYTAGKSINELVERYGITFRHIQNILKCTDASAPESPLVQGKTQGELELKIF